MSALPFSDRAAWRWRWCQTIGGERLHRVIAYARTDEDGFATVRDALTACGLRGDLLMPGLLSRMYAPRCARCCRRLGVERGDGAPYNAGVDA